MKLFNKIKKIYKVFTVIIFIIGVILLFITNNIDVLSISIMLSYLGFIVEAQPMNFIK